MPATKKVTPLNFYIEIPDVDVRSVRIEPSHIEVEMAGRDAEGWSEEIAQGGKKFLEQQAMVRNLMGRGVPSSHEMDEIGLLMSVRAQTRRLPEEAFQEFVKAEEPRDIAAFIQRHGMLQLPKSEPAGSREILTFDDFRRVRSEFLRLVQLWSGISEGSNAVAELAEHLPFSSRPKTALSFALSTQLLDSHLWLVAREGRLDPVLSCPHVLAGIYGLFFKTVVAGSPWTACERCNTLFQRERSIKRYCSERCQSQAKQQRQRDKAQAALTHAAIPRTATRKTKQLAKKPKKRA